MAKERVLVDTCIIIEAFRINCWKALCNRYDVETVEKCIEEACTGDSLDAGRVVIDREELIKGLAKRHTVSSIELARLVLENEGLPGIDDGEKHLLAWMHANRPLPITVLLSTSDKAALRASHVLDLLNRVKSLEELAKAAGVDKRQLAKLENHFLERWLSGVRVELRPLL